MNSSLRASQLTEKNMNSSTLKLQKNAFATPEKESPSPGKKIVSPSDTFGGKKGFLSLFSKKKPDPNEFVQEGSPKLPQQEEPKARLNKLKIINRKNISDGRIRLNVFPNDRVPDDFLIDYKDNPFEVLDQNPIRTTSFIENLKSRDFSEINSREVRRFIEIQHSKQQEIAPSMGVQNLELELIEISDSYEALMGKFFRFFQGLLPGFCIISLFLIFAGIDEQTILNSFVVAALRIYQIFQVVALLAVVGAGNRFLDTRDRHIEASRAQPQLRTVLSRQKVKYFVALLSFLVVYGIIIFNHEFVSLISDKSGNVVAADFSDRFRVFKILSVIMAVGSVIGWFALILAFEEVSKTQMDIANYAEMTADESLAEDTRLEERNY